MSNKLSEQIQEYAQKHSKAPTWALDEWAEQARELENHAASSDREMVMALDQLRDARAERDAARAELNNERQWAAKLRQAVTELENERDALRKGIAAELAELRTNHYFGRRGDQLRALLALLKDGDNSSTAKS